MAIVLYEIPAGQMDLIAPLWEALNLQHQQITTCFSEHFRNNSFASRKTGLLEKRRQGALKIWGAWEGERLVGYCVATVKGGAGELESIFVDEAHRSHGVGHLLITTALEWMDSRKVTRKRLGVLPENQRAIGFYARYGFRPRVLTMEVCHE